MKIRTDFVTNSSSSSFCCWRVESKELAEYLNEIVEEDNGLKVYNDIVEFNQPGETSSIYAVYDQADMCECAYELVEKDYSDEDRDEVTKNIIKHYTKIKNTFPDKFENLDLQLIEKIIKIRNIDISYKALGQFAFEWCVRNNFTSYEPKNQREERKLNIKQFNEHISNFIGTYSSDSLEVDVKKSKVIMYDKSVGENNKSFKEIKKYFSDERYFYSEGYENNGTHQFVNPNDEEDEYDEEDTFVKDYDTYWFHKMRREIIHEIEDNIDIYCENCDCKIVKEILSNPETNIISYESADFWDD